MSHGDHLDFHDHPHPHEDESSSRGESGGAPKWWRSPETRDAEPEDLKALVREFPDGADVLEMDPVSRRHFLGLMGASLALVGASTGCSAIRKPAREIRPWSKRPEDLIPGRSEFYATAMSLGASVYGLLVESQDGRPTKIEGNPRHAMSQGGTTAWVQASVLDMYDPDRSRVPWHDGKETTSQEAAAFLAKHFGEARATGGQGVAILLDGTPSPSLHRLVGELVGGMPQAKVYRHDEAWPANDSKALELLGLPNVRPVPALGAADVVLSVDCDFLATEGDVVHAARGWADRRRVTEPGEHLNRLYVVEPAFTVTGAVADHRLRLKAAEARGFLEAVAARVLASGAPAGSEALAAAVAGKTFRDAKWVQAVADDLLANAGRCLVLAGERQPVAVHVLAHLLNAALGNAGKTLQYVQHAAPGFVPGTLAELTAALSGGQVQTLLVLGGNPVQSAAGGAQLGEALAKAPMSIHLGQHRDETGSACKWHLPQSHWLESWGDLVASDGTLAVVQPLIAPLWDSLTALEVVGHALGQASVDGYSVVRATLAPNVPAGGNADASWRQWLSDGVVGKVGQELPAPAFAWTGAEAALAEPAPSADGLELVFILGNSTHDGRYANNAWLQELPDPMTKLTWDNAACLGPATARKLGVGNGDMVQVGGPAGKVELPAWVTPGLADDVVVLSLGYGRKMEGRVCKGVGTDVGPLRTAAAPHFTGGGSVSRSAGHRKMATTQEHGSLVEPRTGRVRDELVRVFDADEYAKDPKIVEEKDLAEKEELHSLWIEPNVREGHQWGMAIDLNACTGCNACAIACQAENNISVVGRERVLNGREMHWIRLDRYFAGSEDDPVAVMQPVPCMQCENAPCEQVCPVAATTHSPDGLNDMAYNRCIGTRYCANNCPFKVRRFNFFNYSLENDVRFSAGEPKEQRPLLDQVVNRNEPFTLIAMQRNPDVSVRFRGVMEKCTYCTQRIQEAKIAAKVHGDGKVPDGGVVTACAQACPTKAITFGDINDPDSAVSKLKAQERNYAMLAELNIKPRTTYLARLRNPNPALA